MKVYSTSVKSAKTGGVTLKKARQAARKVKGDRPTDKLPVVNASKSRILRDKYLGEIVHSRSNCTREHIAHHA